MTTLENMQPLFPVMSPAKKVQEQARQGLDPPQQIQVETRLYRRMLLVRAIKLCYSNL
jgi:hypothetical protein